jgi:hypothetical protein
MKNLSKLLLVFAFGFWGLNTVRAQSSINTDKAEKATEVKNLISNKDFVFEATNSKGEKSLNYHRYDVAVAKDTLVANLPGYKVQVKIATTDYAFNTMQDKDGRCDIVIIPRNGITGEVRQIKIDVSPEGTAYAYVSMRDKGVMSLKGYIKQEDY